MADVSTCAAVGAHRINGADMTLDPKGMGEDMPRIDLAAIDTDDTGGLREEHAQGELAALRDKLADLQDRLFAEEERALLIVLQGMDGSGKDTVISKLLSACDPSGLRVHNFKKPAGEEAAHDFLWRFHQQTPAKGMVQVFDRSHYEEVIYPRVHDLIDEDLYRARLESINDFERMLVREGTTVLKFFLHISRDEQLEKFRERLERPDKYWKWSDNDIKERERWDEYQQAYEDAVNATSTPWAPWYVVPADRKWFRNWVVSRILVDTLQDMDPQYPPGEDLTGVVVT